MSQESDIPSSGPVGTPEDPESQQEEEPAPSVGGDRVSEGEGDEDELGIPIPDRNWKFNSFLVDLADEIDENELDKLKHMFTDVIGRRVLETFKSARDLFDTLRKRGFLRENNLLCLQSILMKLRRPELIKMAIDYAAKVGEVLHFHPAEEPADGYRSIKVHVEGKDFRSCTQRYVKNLRQYMSGLLFIPEAHVIIAGVEPSSSMLLTIWIPDMYADIFMDMLERKYQLKGLCDLEIDTLQIGDKIFNIAGIEGAELVETEEQTKLVNVYQQLKDKTRQLDSMELEQIKTSLENKKLCRKVEDLELESVALRTMFHNSTDGKEKQPAKLNSQAAFAIFKTGLGKMMEQGCNKKAIQDLLYANSIMISNRSTETIHYHLGRLGLQVQELQSQLWPLTFEVELHRTTSSGDLEKILRDMLQNLMQSIKIPQQKVEQTLTDHGNSILRTISQKIKHRERQKLEGRYKWKANDKLTHYKRDPSMLLSCLFYKELEKTQQLVDFHLFVENCLTDINRKDLLQKFKEMINQPPPTPETPRQQHQQQQRNRSTAGSRSQERQAPSSPQEEPLTKLENEIHEIWEKVSRIESTIESVKKAGVPYETQAEKPFMPGASIYGKPYVPQTPVM